MKNELYTKELEAEVVEEYRNGASYADICVKHNLINANVDYLLRKAKEPRRRSFKKGVKENSQNLNKKCPKCRKKIDVFGARFCPFCGSDIRTEGEMLAERLKKLCEYALDMPEQIRDEFISALNAAIRMVNKNDRK